MQPPADKRRADLAKIHLAKKDLCMSDDDYAAVMLCVSNGRTSSAGELDVRERGQVLEHFKRCGWKPKPRNSGAYSRPVAADSAEARKVRTEIMELMELLAAMDAELAAI
jgi:phage gp16-like protein